jgi:pimeloyl-ACP methyl ester carboxylesterase
VRRALIAARGLSFRPALLEFRRVSVAPALLYLHGLASSPKGRKKEMLEKRLAAEGWRVVAPDLNVLEQLAG